MLYFLQLKKRCHASVMERATDNSMFSGGSGGDGDVNQESTKEKL